MGELLREQGESAFRDTLTATVVGDIDHGKSTLLGRLLFDAGEVSAAKVEQIKSYVEQQGIEFSFAYLIDAMRDERKAGITIESSRVFFRTESRNYSLIDTPGHREFVRNMVTGASRAQLAILVVDASQGLEINSHRHCYLLHFLGLKNVLLVVNKMDLVSYSESVVAKISQEVQGVISKFGLNLLNAIPVSAAFGENVVNPSLRMPWYTGRTFLGELEALSLPIPNASEGFRMFVQGSYGKREVAAGTVLSGKVCLGESLTIYPGGTQATVTGIIKSQDGSISSYAQAGESIGLQLEVASKLERGNLIASEEVSTLHVGRSILATLFSLSEQLLSTGTEYTLKLGTQSVKCKLKKIIRAVDPHTLHEQTETESISHSWAADCVIELSSPICFESMTEALSAKTSRFVLVSNSRICGAGVIRAGADSGRDTQELLLHGY